jgi:methylmalonyl-CoA mutase cobalamin-binding subunit
VREDVIEFLQILKRKGRATREDYLAGAAALEARRLQSGGRGLWPQAPRMMTATLDDGWGHGLQVIEALSNAVGVAVQRRGLLQTPAAIVKACREERPDLLGLTVLQFDSDEALLKITRALPTATTLVAGGAAFRYDSDFAKRTGTHVVARDGTAFLQFLLGYEPSHPREG